VVCVDLTIDDLLLSLSYIDGGESFEFLVAEVGSEIKKKKSLNAINP
jgi:hypothetical protein